MDSLGPAKLLASEGRFSQALRVVEGLRNNRSSPSTSILRAELLQRLGRCAEARQLAERLLRSTGLALTDRSLCHYVLGRLHADDGDLGSAIRHLQQSIAFAHNAKDFERAAWSQSRLLTIVSDTDGPDAVGPLVSELRSSALKSANPRVMAAVHLYVGLIEARRGLSDSARRHMLAASNLLTEAPNVWLASMVEHITATLLIMTADFQSALVRSERSVILASECGQKLSLAASHGNHAHLLYIAGKLSAAREHSQQALAGFSPRSDNYIGILDSLAQIELASGDVVLGTEYVQQIERSIFSEVEWRRYAYRHSLITKAKFERQDGLLAAALTTLDAVIRIADETQDEWLWKLGIANKIGVLAELRKTDDAIQLMDAIGHRLASFPPDLFAVYEGMLATCFITIGNRAAADEHLCRAQRVLSGLGHSIGATELQQMWNRVNAGHKTPESSETVDWTASGSSGMVRWIAAMLACIRNTELLAKEAIELLRACDSVVYAKVVKVDSSAKETDLFYVGDESGTELIPRRIKCGVDSSGCAIDLIVRPAARADAVATVNAMTTLLQTIDEVKSWRLQREERVSLWPLDASFDGGDVFVAGHIQELMQFTQRVARANVTVLVTGESGTGKEIIARAIHNFSDRAKKPFVPFNCAAIPRDLAETQLFGHRRGAFTGADRDSPGVIRAARDGTLFLDEIGELALDLQPKLLRFLESGEIAPLGEPAPLTVNVRVVAATNRNLDDLVQSGHFREDLFYRLNVVRLNIKPLRERRDEIPGLVHGFVARAASEFKKGHLEIAEETMERLILYRWPGNVRQLQHELQRIVALAEPGSTILPDAIHEDILAALPLPRPAPRHPEISVPLNSKLQPTLAKIETEMIKAALRDHHGRVEDVAKALGISRKGLYLKRQRFGL